MRGMGLGGGGGVKEPYTLGKQDFRGERTRKGREPRSEKTLGASATVDSSPSAREKPGAPTPHPALLRDPGG